MQNITEVHFFAVTKYHIIVAGLVRGSLPEGIKSVLIVNNVLPDASEICLSIAIEDDWSKVLEFDCSVVKNFSNKSMIGKLISSIILNLKVKNFIKTHQINEFYTFTVGDMASNYFSANKRIKNKYLGEDGTFPYYGGVQMYDADNQHQNRMIKAHDKKRGISSLWHYLRSYLFNAILPGLEINTREWFKEAVLIEPDLYDASRDLFAQNIRSVKPTESFIKSIFTKYTNVFKYTKSDIYNNVDVIFIDSGMVSDNILTMEEQIDFSINLLQSFANKKILIKVSPYCSKERLVYLELKLESLENIYIDFDNLKVPWEVVFYNNMEKLLLSTIVTYRSTAVISPFILFGAKPKICVFCCILMNKFNLVGHDRVYTEQFISLIERLKAIYPEGSVSLPLIDSLNEVPNA